MTTRARRSLGAMMLFGWLGLAAWVADGGAASPESSSNSARARKYVDFDFDWRFSRGDFATAAMPEFDDSSWRTVQVPHDWSIEGPLGPEYASGNGFAPGGVAWYRKQFTLAAADRGKLVAVEFDGVYDHSEIWVNGQFVGGRPYGYSSFQLDLTPFVRFGDQGNLIAVRVDHSRFADSRWYTGSGIYRNVRLRITDTLRIAHWGTYVTTPKVAADSAVVRIETTVASDGEAARTFALHTGIVAADGRVVGSVSTPGSLASGARQTVVQQISLDQPQLWSVDSPTLYTVESRLVDGGRLVDDTSTPLGIRTLQFDPNLGFALNGQRIKIKGVCIHHDAGWLGAAVPEQVLERRLRTLKELGANAIRTSHNPPAPELLDLCDRLGLLVMDEAFDEFTPGKNKWVAGRNVGLPSRWGYAEEFAQWSVVDIEDMVRRDRNHPCVFMWSIGNEIDYPNDPFSHPALGSDYRPENPRAEIMVEHAKPLIEAVKRLDPTRPVTAGLASVAMSDAVGLAALLDVVGYNYQESRYAADHQRYPDRFLFGSETGTGVNQWNVVGDNAYVAGQFLWTGIDYLGEAGRFPNRGSAAGLLDLCGFKKPSAWLRQSLWSDEPMVYLSVAGGGGRGGGGRSGMGRGPGGETWNGTPGANVTVVCYTNCPEVMLTLNDEPLATQSASQSNGGALRFGVAYQPGVLKAVGRKDGAVLCDFVLKTAGPAARVALLPDVTSLRADGKDVCQVELQIVDAQGVRVAGAQNDVAFEVEGPAEILGIENGNLTIRQDGKDHALRARNGRGLAVFRSTRSPGEITVRATAFGLEPAVLKLESSQGP